MLYDDEGPRDQPQSFVVVEVMTRYSNHVKLMSWLVNLQRELDRQAPVQRPATIAPRVHKLERRLAPEVFDQIIRDYQAGSSSNQLMRDYKLGKGTVLRILHEAGVIGCR
jgi:hypothetical protein